MMDYNASQIISDYIRNKDEVFTLDEFYKYLKAKGVKITKPQVLDVLRTSDYVFCLVNDEFITRSGVFEGRWFSFKPTKEEIDKGYMILGHRCIPFICPDTNPDSISVLIKGKVVNSEVQKFTMNLAMDVFALFGEGYVIPYILNDKGNETVPLSSVQYQLPNEISLTCWPLKPFGNIQFGDRILCRVVNWDESIVEMTLLKNDVSGMVVSQSAILREQWYTEFENGILASFDKNGPADSIEEQLAYLFLENQETLCVKTCGSAEEFLKHTTKIGFSPFGIESRIWKQGEAVPYVGEWNKSYAKNIIMSDINMTYSPAILDAFIEDYIYSATKGENNQTLQELSYVIFPSELKLTASDRKNVMLNLEKRHDILSQVYNQFSDYPIASFRKRILNLFSQVIVLLFGIGCSEVDVQKFPQQEMVVLSQLFGHLVRLLEEVENVFIRDQLPLNDMELSLGGMEDTFEEISGTLKSSFEFFKTNGFELVKLD